MKVNHLAVVLALMLSIALTLSGIEAGASDYGWTPGQSAAVSSGDFSASTNQAPSVPGMSQVGKNTNGGAGSGVLQACKNEQTISDTTMIQRWQKGQADPPPYNWADVIGPKEVFETTQMVVIWSGADVTIQLFTNFPEAGHQSGTLYLPADLAFDFNLDGVWDEGVVLTNHSTIPADPIPPAPPQPPGFGQAANTFVKGNRYSATAWFTSNDIVYNWSGYGGMYDEANPKIPPVWMRLGTLLGSAQVTWNNLGGDPKYRVDVLLQGVNTSGKWNKFNVLWGTATCANDVITGQANKPCRDMVPGMNGWTVLLTGLLILGSGIWALKRKRAT